MFGLVVALVGVAIAGVERSIGLSHVLRRLQNTTAQIRVRAAFVLMIGFAALADQFGLETILGAFAAGVLLSLIDRDQTTHPQFRLKLDAAAFGVFIPVFFVTSGLRFNLNALFASPSTVARVPLFLLAIYLARGLPAIVYLRLLGRSCAVIAGVLQATSLTVIVAATQIGLQLGVVSQASAAGTRCRRSSLGGDLPGPRTRAAPPRTARKSFKALDPTRTVAHAGTPSFNTGIAFVGRRRATRTIASATEDALAAPAPGKCLAAISILGLPPFPTSEGSPKRSPDPPGQGMESARREVPDVAFWKSRMP